MSEEELISTCILLLNAGHEATVHTIGNGIRAVLQSGLAPARIFADAAGAVEEVLRFDPPLHMFRRYALDDVEIGPARIRKGEEIGLLLGAANRDPLRFEEPERSSRDASGRRMSVSAAASISASVRRWLASNWRWRSPCCSERLPGLRLGAVPLYGDTYHFHGLTTLDVAW